MLRRLVLEWSLREISKKLTNPKNLQLLNTFSSDTQAAIQGLKTLEILKRIKTLEVLQLLRFTPEEFAAIIKIETKTTTENPDNFLQDMFALVRGKIQFLERQKDGAHIYFVTGTMPPPSPQMDSKYIMYPSMPFSYQEGKFRATLVGDTEQVKQLLDTFERINLRYRVVSLTAANFSPSSPVACLTVKQQEALVLAFRLGYFDTPRKVSVDELADRLGLASSTLAVHLRRAERRLLAEVLKEDS